MSGHGAALRAIGSTVGTVEGFHVAMTVVDVDGWDSEAGWQLLEYARRAVVMPVVRAQCLPASAVEDVIAFAWAAAWRALGTSPIREACSPWGALRVAVERAAGGACLAERYGGSARTGWRRRAAGDPVPVVIATAPADFESSAVCAAQAVTGQGLGPRLEWIRAVLVRAGWAPGLARDALEWVASNYSGSPRGTHDGRHRHLTVARSDSGELVDVVAAARTPRRLGRLRCASCGTHLALQVTSGARRGGAHSSCVFRLARGASHAPGCVNDITGGVRGWRSVAGLLGLEPWQLRRLALLVAGGSRHVGLVELVVTRGRAVLDTATVRRAVAATLDPSAPCPSSALPSRGLTGATSCIRRVA